MKTKFLFIGIGLMLSAVQAFALTGLESGTKYGTGEDSIRAKENLQIFTFYGKQKQYAEALPAWEIVYKEAPASSTEIYRLGVQILKWQINSTNDAAKKTEYFNQLMKLFDDRIVYFGNDSKYPKPWILSQKVMAYAELKEINPNYSNEVVYNWAKEAVEGLKGASSANLLLYYISASAVKFSEDNSHAATYIDEYLKVGNMLDAKIALADKNQASYISVKEIVNNQFVASGAADCATLEKVFAQSVEENKANYDELQKTIDLFEAAGCSSSELYFKASRYAHQIKPASSSAKGLAEQSYKNGNYAEAIAYFEEAISLSDNVSENAKTAYKIAVIYQKELNNKSKARAYAQKAIEGNPTMSEPYILIATLYATSGKDIYDDDPILAKTVYWAAVDVLQRALNAGADKADAIRQLIASFKEVYPSQEQVFFHPDLEVGKTFTIGGWMGVTVNVR